MNGVATGVLFGLMNALIGDDDGPVAGFPGPVFQGLFFGLLMGPFLAILGVRQRRRTLEATGDASSSQVAASSRAALRGPVPTEPEARQVAYKLARYRLEQLERQRVFGLFTFTVMLALSIYLAIAVNPWMWLIAAFFISYLAYMLWLPGRLRRRVELLRPGVGPAGG